MANLVAFDYSLRNSRNVSAEIFVVCRDFLAPKHIDPKFLDPRHVFKDISASEPGVDKDPSAIHAQANVFQPEKKRRHRDGYADGDYTLFKTIPARDFVRGGDPIALLGTANKIIFENEEEREYVYDASISPIPLTPSSQGG
jgi:AdoMet-dependent rRNA methyltransferase SPB1